MTLCRTRREPPHFSGRAQAGVPPAPSPQALARPQGAKVSVVLSQSVELRVAVWCNRNMEPRYLEAQRGV